MSVQLLGASLVGRRRQVDDDTIMLGTARALGRLGYARLTLAAVAEEVGLSPASLIQRFGSKRDLLLAFFDWDMVVRQARVADLRRLHSSPLAALRARFLKWADFIPAPTTVANLLSLSVESVTDPEFRERANRRVKAQEAEVTALLEEAVASGELAPGDIPRLSRVLLAAETGALLHWAVAQGGPAREWIDDAFDVIIGPWLPGRQSEPVKEAE